MLVLQLLPRSALFSNACTDLTTLLLTAAMGHLVACIKFCPLYACLKCIGRWCCESERVLRSLPVCQKATADVVTKLLHDHIRLFTLINFLLLCQAKVPEA